MNSSVSKSGDLWGDLSDWGWSRLTLWERWLAHLFLPEDSDSLPATRDRWAAAADPLSQEEADWFLAGPPRSAPDPLSRFKLRALQVFPPRLQKVAVRLAEVSLARGIAGPSLTTSATGHLPKLEGGTRHIGLLADVALGNGDPSPLLISFLPAGDMIQENLSYKKKIDKS